VTPEGRERVLGVVWATNSVLPMKPVKYKEPRRKLPAVAVAVTGVFEPLGKNTEALLTCIEPVPVM